MPVVPLDTRLRAGEYVLAWAGGAVPEPSHDEFMLINPDGPEAADRIALLEADLAKAREQIETAADVIEAQAGLLNLDTDFAPGVIVALKVYAAEIRQAAQALAETEVGGE